MKKGTFTYCLLQYRHSQLLGEILNIGLLVYFPTFRKLQFISPEKLIRLRFAYPNVPEKTIRSYYKFFEKRVEELNLTPDVFSDYDLNQSLEQFVNNELLPSDSSALQFGNYKTSVLYTTDLDHIANQLYNLYFSVFETQENTVKRIDESILLLKYKKLLKEYSHQDKFLQETPKFQYDYFIETDTTAKISFDVAWKEENQLHLVKPLSFDLKRVDSLNKKAYQYYGQFTHLQGYAEKENYLFDVLLAKPKNKSLFGAYDKAIKLLQEPKRVTLIEFDDLNSYSQITAESALN